MASSHVLCGRCGAVLTNPGAPCPKCGAPASGGYQAAAPASGSYQAARPMPHKNPALAAALAILPGCGHFYLGHNAKGAGFLIGIAGFQLFDLGLDLSVVGAAIGVPLELGPGALWVFSIVDAYRTAKHMEQVAGYYR